MRALAQRYKLTGELKTGIVATIAATTLKLPCHEQQHLQDSELCSETPEPPGAE